jgi:uncharacterized protein (TIGR00730 family)
MKKIAVFCSANNDIDQRYFDAAEELGKQIAAQGDELVYGGCNMGLMECLARATHENGGRVIGVIPTKLEKDGRVSQYIDVEIPCDNLADRKELMELQADVTVALPGGIGTLDEIFTVAARHTIGYSSKKVYLLNIGGFWNPLIAMLRQMQEQHFMRMPYTQHLVAVDTVAELCEAICK